MPFRTIDDPVKLRRLLEATLLLESDLSLSVLLRHLVEEACALSAARYGALGVLSEDGTSLAEFITVGLDEPSEDAIGDRPTGNGILGLLITEPEAIRLTDIREHAQSSGFPPNHPTMKSFLGVPVSSHEEIYGNLYLADKIGWSEFSRDDEEMVKALAVAAGIAIENARLHQRVKDTVVLDDRDRIARDLHDAVIQRLFAVGLTLQGTAKSLPPGTAVDRIQQAIVDLDGTISQIRSTIFELSSSHRAGTRSDVLALVSELESVVGTEVRVSFEGSIDVAITDEISEHLLHTIREGLTNVGRHADAASVNLSLVVQGDSCVLTIADDGQGMSTPDSKSGGLGLGNMRRRAEKFGGSLSLESTDRGTTLIWTVQLQKLNR